MQGRVLAVLLSPQAVWGDEAQTGGAVANASPVAALSGVHWSLPVCALILTVDAGACTSYACSI